MCNLSCIPCNFSEYIPSILIFLRIEIIKMWFNHIRNIAFIILLCRHLPFYRNRLFLQWRGMPSLQDFFYRRYFYRYSPRIFTGAFRFFSKYFSSVKYFTNNHKMRSIMKIPIKIVAIAAFFTFFWPINYPSSEE